MSVQISEKARIAIDWGWGNNGSPNDYICPQDEIEAGVKRGATTAHNCVVNAIKAAKSGKMDAAMNWLAAIQCHNPGDRQAIRDAGQAAVDYALERYGNQV